MHSAEKAAFYLDAALATRGAREDGKDSHLLYTLHVYQYSVGGKGAGRLSEVDIFIEMEHSSTLRCIYFLDAALCTKII